MTATRALVYTRQSIGKPGEDEETSLSLSAQFDRIQSYCAREGWQIVDTVADHDLSGERWDRPGLQQLIDRVRAGGVDVVVVFALNRFARKVLHQEMVVDMLKEHGAELVSVTEAGIDNVLVRVVHGGMAEQHNVNHRKILRASLEMRAKRGLHHGRTPYGYSAAGDRVTGRRLEVVPAEAAVVRRVFQMRADGLSLKTIANRLNDDGVVTRNGTPWHMQTIRYILKGPTYAGYAVYRGEIVGDLAPGVAEPLVDRTLWHQIQRQFDGNTRSERNPAHRVSWLSGLVRHVCGAKMHPSGSGYCMRNGRRMPVDRGFRCATQINPRAFHCRTLPGIIAVSAIEMAAAHCLVSDLQNRPLDPATLIQLRSTALGQPDAVKRRAQLMKQKTALIDQIKRAEELVTTGRRDLEWFDAFDGDAQAQLLAIESELAELMAIPTEDDYTTRLNALRRLAPDPTTLPLSSATMRTVLAALGHVVFDGTVRIEYAPEFRDCFPEPTRIRPVFRRSKPERRWVLAPCS